MSASIIQTQRDALLRIAQRLGQQAESAAELDARFHTELRNFKTGWEGKAADAFFNEMNRVVLPGIKRLNRALVAAQEVTLQIIEVFRQAEEEASRPFRDGHAVSTVAMLVPPTSDPTVFAIQDIDPNTTDEFFYNPEYKYFLGTISPDGISPNDVRQGQVGDCYFLASLISIANQNPDIIQNAILDNGDGTYTVTFYRDGQPVQVTVDSDFPVTVDSNGNATDIPAFASTGSRTDELWPMIIEKAYAIFSNEGYAGIDGGYPEDAMLALTNKPSDILELGVGSDPAAPVTIQDIARRLANHENITASTRSETTGEDLSGWPQAVIPLHAYSVDHVDVANGLVYLRNPWGAAYTPLPMTMEEFNKYFDYMAAN